MDTIAAAVALSRARGTMAAPVKVVQVDAHGTDAARREQAFSYDGGREGETNWTVELTRP